MNRRQFLAAAAGAGAVGLSGCAGLPGVGGGGDGPPTLQGYDFSLDVTPRRQRAGNPTIVAFDPEADEVRVTGFAYYGSSSCDTLGVRTVEFSREEATLRTVVEARTKSGPLDILPFDVPLPVGCTADMAGTTYRLTARFARGLPEVVEVFEDARGGLDRNDRAGGEFGGNRRVVRDDQRRLCAGSGPEQDAQRRKRHWTCPERYLAVEESADADDG